MATAYIGLGANLGDAAAALHAAIDALRSWGPLRASPLYRSAPVDAEGPDYLNAVVELQTDLRPPVLLARLQALELDFGRLRPYRNAPRTLDLDLLLVDDQRIATVDLTLPHPRLHLRAFVLRPLLDLVPDLNGPGLGRLAAHLPALADQRIERINPPLSTRDGCTG